MAQQPPGNPRLENFWRIELSYLFFDTGVMYRAATLAAMQKNLDLSDENAINALDPRDKDRCSPAHTSGRQTQ